MTDYRLLVLTSKEREEDREWLKKFSSSLCMIANGNTAQISALNRFPASLYNPDKFLERHIKLKVVLYDKL